MVMMFTTLMTAMDTQAEDYGHICWFDDVKDESVYYYKPVYWAKAVGVTTGRSGTNLFDPNATCTRAEIVTFLWRAAGKPEPESETCQFDDVSSEAYYNQSVQWAYEQGITTGRRNTNNFDPKATCTRREIVTFLWRFAGRPEPGAETSKFTDITDESAYYYKAVLWAVEKDITTGKASSNYTTFDPLGLCTRGMSVTFLYRYMATDFYETNEIDIGDHIWVETDEEVLVKEAEDVEEEYKTTEKHCLCNVYYKETGKFCDYDLDEECYRRGDMSIDMFFKVEEEHDNECHNGPAGYYTKNVAVTRRRTVHHDAEYAKVLKCSECHKKSVSEITYTKADNN